MPKVTIRTQSGATPCDLPEGCAGDGQAHCYFANSDRDLQLHRLDLPAGGAMRFFPILADRLGYVWDGELALGGVALAPGSIFIVERGALAQIQSPAQDAAVLLFSASGMAGSPPGGNVHLLPADRAPRSDALGGVVGLGGTIYADADCGTCALWLHENRFPPVAVRSSAGEPGVHAHSEDEIIVVIDGEIRLGEKLFGRGTAIMIAADTLYSFTAGPGGLAFINFRGGKPGDIRFASGQSMSETQYWRERLPRPQYLTREVLSRDYPTS